MEIPLYRFLIAILLLAGCPLTAQTTRTYHLGSTPETVYRGFFPRNAKPAIRVPSGATVDVDTLSHQGLNSYMTCVPLKGDLSASQCKASGELDPVAFQAKEGVGASEVPPDATNVFYKLDYATRRKTGGGHVLTGPIHVDGASRRDAGSAHHQDQGSDVVGGQHGGSGRRAAGVSQRG